VNFTKEVLQELIENSDKTRTRQQVSLKIIEQQEAYNFRVSKISRYFNLAFLKNREIHENEVLQKIHVISYVISCQRRWCKQFQVVKTKGGRLRYYVNIKPNVALRIS